MAEIKNDPPRWREWLSEKLNPAQPSIASLEPYASPETIVDFEQAYREIEIIHRAVEMVIAACVDTPLKVTGQTPAKKVNKLLNIRPNPFEDRVRFFRRALLDFHLDGNAFFYYDGNDLYLLKESSLPKALNNFLFSPQTLLPFQVPCGLPFAQLSIVARDTPNFSAKCF